MPLEHHMSDDVQPQSPATAPGPGSTPPTTTAQTLTRCLAILSCTAAVIHFAVADMHYQEYWAFGVFMVTTAILQMSWAVAALLTRGSRWLWAGGALLNGGIVAVYVVTRTIGDVVGPTPHEVEPVGFGDAFCTALEVLLVIGCVALLVERSTRVVRARQAGWMVSATGAVMAGLLVVALLDGGSEMTMSADASPATATAANASSHMAMTGKSAKHMSMNNASNIAASAIHLKTTSPAGAVEMPQPGMQMEAGMKMASGPCTATPTAAQQAFTVRLVNQSWRDAQRFRSLAAAKAAGYVPITPVGLPVVHYLNMASYRSTLLGGAVIKPADPQSLVYANTPKGAVLAASMYLTRPGTTSPPQPGGCLTQWHVHTNLCFGSFGTVVGLTEDGKCAPGGVHRPTPPMTHIWYIPIPGGPTAVDASDAQVVHAAMQVRAPHNGTA
jgi:hypothetical protein